MKKLFIIVVLLVFIYYLANLVMNQLFINGLPAALILSGTNPNKLEGQIISYYRDVIQNSGLDKGGDILRVGDYHLSSQYIDINNDQNKDLIVIVDSRDTCNNNGCLATVFLQKDRSGDFEPISFTFTVKEIEPLETFTNNMRDLRINSDLLHTMHWDGDVYTL